MVALVLAIVTVVSAAVEMISETEAVHITEDGEEIKTEDS